MASGNNSRSHMLIHDASSLGDRRPDTCHICAVLYSVTARTGMTPAVPADDRAAAEIIFACFAAIWHGTMPIIRDYRLTCGVPFRRENSDTVRAPAGMKRHKKSRRGHTARPSAYCASSVSRGTASNPDHCPANPGEPSCPP